MGYVSQLVLFASTVACCVSYSIDSTKTMQVPEPPLEPSDSDFSEFPTKFMSRLIASLSPEVLEELRKPIIPGDSNLDDRDGNTEEKLCPSKRDTQYVQIAKGTDGEVYWAISSNQDLLQPIPHFACDNDAKNNSCNTRNPTDIHLHCCHQREDKAIMAVIPLPIRALNKTDDGDLYLNGTLYTNYTMAEKEVWVNSDCSCVEYQGTIATDDTCPSPSSKLLDLYQ